MSGGVYPEGAVAASHAGCVDPAGGACRRPVRAVVATARRLATWLAIVAALALLPAMPVAAAGAPRLEARWRVLAEPASEGAATTVALDVTLDPGWHVNAHDPGRPYLVPTELAVELAPGTTLDGIRYPDAVVRRLAFAGDDPLRLYEGAFAIEVRLSGALPDRLTGRLRYQACNDETCLPPKTLPVTLDLARRVPAASGARSARTDSSSSGSFEHWIDTRGLLATLALAMVLGLGLNLTPCVYPLISVTIAYFGGQSHGSLGRVAVLATAYVLGIAVTFSALGVFAALSGGLFGAALQQPVVLACVALVLVALAASNFGLYQFRMPTALMQRAGRASTGLVGALAMGLTMGVVAAPCVGPVVVALLLFVAARQDAMLGLLLFFALAVGMGAPYVGLALAAGSIKRLPRSGEWLAWVERLFAFVLLGMALHFAEPLLGARAADRAWPALVAGAAVYLGFVDTSGRDIAAFVRLKRVVGIAGVAVALWLAMPRAAASTVAWQPFSPRALEAATASGRPAIVDFTATWCLPCRENDTITFTDHEVGDEASRFLMLRADVTATTPEQERWMHTYDVLGVPTIVFFDASGVEKARHVGFIEASRLLALMREVR